MSATTDAMIDTLRAYSDWAFSTWTRPNLGEGVPWRYVWDSDPSRPPAPAVPQDRHPVMRKLDRHPRAAGPVVWLARAGGRAEPIYPKSIEAKRGRYLTTLPSELDLEFTPTETADLVSDVLVLRAVSDRAEEVSQVWARARMWREAGQHFRAEARAGHALADQIETLIPISAAPWAALIDTRAGSGAVDQPILRPVRLR